MKTAANKTQAAVTEASGGRSMVGGGRLRVVAALLGLLGIFQAHGAYGAGARPETAPASGVSATTQGHGATSRNSPTSAPVGSLYTQGTAGRLWVATVTRENKQAPYNTVIQYKDFADGRWGILAPIQNQLVGISTQERDLVALFGDGELALVGLNRFVIGRRLPYGQSPACVANDENDTLWAIGPRLEGGSITKPASAASTAENSMEGGVAEEGGESEAEWSDQTPPPGYHISSLWLWAFAVVEGKWRPIAPAPADFPRDGSCVSLDVIGDQVFLAFVEDGRARAYVLEDAKPSGSAGRMASTAASTTGSTQGATNEVKKDPGVEMVEKLAAGGRWRTITPPDFEGAAWQVRVFGADQPALWVAGATGAGRIYFLRNRHWEAVTDVIALPSGVKSVQGRSITVAAGKIHLMALSNGALFDQIYSIAGELEAPWARMTMGDETLNARIARIVSISMVVLFVLVIIGSFIVRRGAVAPKSLPAAAQLARLSVRLAAAMIDLWPLMLIFWFCRRELASGDLGAGGMAMKLGNPQYASVLQWLMILHGGYLLYTILTEMIFGRTIGKMLFGLRVVTLNGTPAGAWALLTRNAMRLIDFSLFGIPLLLVIFTPLRQRVGDIAAGTVVIDPERVEKKPEKERDEE